MSILYVCRKNRMYINHHHFWPAGVSNSERAANNSQHALVFYKSKSFQTVPSFGQVASKGFFFFSILIVHYKTKYTSDKMSKYYRCLILKMGILTYPRPRHPNLLATSRCKRPSKRDLSSGEKESGNSTFWWERRNRKRLMSLNDISLNMTLCHVGWCSTFTRCLLLFH